ncbi:MAG: MAPEG family protein [Paracoccaceae bacterium]|nr:MAPEG family protein [Paracoccaceae bacterium]
MMNYLSIEMTIALGAVFAQVLLGLYVELRTILLQGRDADGTAVPDTWAARHAENQSEQFQMPLLLLSAVAFAAIFDAASMPFALSCLAYVVTRVLHRIVHLQGGSARTMRQVRATGLVLMALIWAFLAVALVGQS